MNDTTMLTEAARFPVRPDDLRSRVDGLLANVGAGRVELEHSVDRLRALFAEVVALSGDLYAPIYDLAGSLG